MAGKLRAAVAAFIAIWAMPTRAAWLEASTRHFIIDANTSAPRIREFAIRLERFDTALRRIYGIKDDPSAASNRLTIYAVGRSDIARLCAGCPSGTAGFYHDRVGAPLAFTAALSGSNDGRDLTLDSQEVLLHEYSHHFMYRNFSGAYPLWFSEGFAELNANSRFEPDGSVIVGLPANYRAAGLQFATPLPIRTLIDAKKPAEARALLAGDTPTGGYY